MVTNNFIPDSWAYPLQPNRMAYPTTSLETLSTCLHIIHGYRLGCLLGEILRRELDCVNIWVDHPRNPSQNFNFHSEVVL